MYQNITARFTEKVNSDSRRFHAKLVFSSGDVIESGIRSVKQANMANSGTESIELGGTTAAQIDIELVKPDFEVTGREFQLYIGLETEDDRIEYVPMGKFTAQKPSATDDNVLKFTAYDRMVSVLEKPFFSDIQNYPADAKVILAEIKEKTGIAINGFSDLPNGIMVDRRTEYADDETSSVVAPFAGYTYRETVGYIAQMFGTFATMDREGDLSFRWYSETPYTVGTDRSLSDIECAETVFRVQKVECQTGDGTLSVGDGPLGISISNPAMTQSILDGVYEKVAGMEYIPVTFSFLGNPCIDLGDIISVKKSDGTLIRVPVMRIEQDYDGGLTTFVGSYGDTEESAEMPKGPTAKAIDRVYADLFLVKEVMADKVSAQYLEANYAKINELDVIQANVQNAVIKNLEGEFATVDYLKANYVSAERFSAETAIIKDLSSGIAKIDTLIFGSASGNVIQTQFANSVVAQLGDAQIRSAMIMDVAAEKITSGSIYTNRVHIYGDGSNRLSIVDNTIAINDGTNTRVQIGKDASGDYNMYIWDGEGNLMFDAAGLTEDGVTRKVIRDDVIKDDANISAKKLDIGSLFSVINEDGTHTLNSSKVYIDADGQTLDIAFKQMVKDQEDASKEIASWGTQITAIQGQISTKIWQQDITSATGEVKEEMATRFSSLEQDLNGFKITVGSTYTTNKEFNALETALDTRVKAAESSITQMSNEIGLKVSESSITGDYLVGKINLTNTTATIDASKINLNGLVTIMNNNMRIGGVNLWKNTKPFSISGRAVNTSGASKIGTVTSQSDGSLYIVNSSSNVRIYMDAVDAVPGQTVTVSVKFKNMSNATTFQLQIFELSSSGIVTYSSSIGEERPLADGWVLKSYTWTMKNPNAIKFQCAFRSGADFALYTHSYYIKEPMVEYAATPSSYSKSPEETSVENIYTSGTTTIDGGKITTGSITADKINVTDLFSKNITATNITVTGSSKVGGFNTTANSLTLRNTSTLGSSYYGETTLSCGYDSYSDPGKLMFVRVTDTKYEAMLNYGGLAFYKNGTLVSNIDNEGNLTLERSITAGGYLNVAGTIYEGGTLLSSKYNPLINITRNGTAIGTDGRSLASGTSWVNVGTFTVPAGTCLVIVSITFDTNANGRRLLCISTTSTGAPMSYAAADRRAAVSGGQSVCEVVMPIVTSVSTTYYINAMQNSGSALGTYTRLTTIKLK